jgi:hypothetical protein
MSVRVKIVAQEQGFQSRRALKGPRIYLQSVCVCVCVCVCNTDIICNAEF